MSSPNGNVPVPDPADAQTQRLASVAAPAEAISSAGSGAAGVAGAPAQPAPSAATAAIVPVGGLAAARPTLDGSLAELRRRRYELAERVAELTWDLGGLTYEMAIRDHYRLDVLARRASELQQADAQLAEVQRLLSGAEGGIHGQCRSCGAVHSRGASFCWHCGAGLIEEARPSVLPDAERPD
jgi:chorismate mutase